MTHEWIAAGIISFGIIAFLGVLFLGGLLLRHDVARAAAGSRQGTPYATSRIIEDLRPLQNTVVEFIAATDPSRRVLEFLSGRQAIRLRDQIARAPERTLAGLIIIAVAGLVRLGRGGLSVTSAGREIAARTRGRLASDERSTSPSLQSAKPTKTPRLPGASAQTASEIDGTSHLRLVNEALRKNESLTSRKEDRRTPPFRLGQLRTGTELSSPAQASESERPTARPDGASSPLMLTAADHHELSAVIVAARKLAVPGGEMRVLQDKLARAAIVHAGVLPADLITLNSRAELVDLATGERLDLTLVFPIDADLEAGRISVLDSLGAAMLGHRVGDRFDWTVPYGVRRFAVRAVHFQPEAVLALAA